MKQKLFIAIALMLCTISSNAQTQLDPSGIYRLKVVEEYADVPSGDIFDNCLSVLPGLTQYNNANRKIDLLDKEAGIILFSGEYFLDSKTSNMIFSYDVYANVVLKIKCKDGKAQYCFEVPSFKMYKSGKTNNFEIVNLSEVIPEYTHKGRLPSLKKCAEWFAYDLDEEIKKLCMTMISKTKNVRDMTMLSDDF